MPRQLPADVGAFVNRTVELGELDAVLSGGEGGPLVVSVYVIAGTAGAGKTSLALRWAHRVAARFPDGQLYVNLRGYDPGKPVTAQEALHRFLVALGVGARAVPEDPDAAAALYRSLLAERRVLIVLDNAAAVSQVRPLLPGGGSSLVLVTSRSRLSGLAVREGARRLTLGTLPEAEAVALLHAVTRGYRPQDDLEKLTELAGLCARLPLALRIAAERAASHPHMRLDDLIADLRDESALWDALSTGDDEEAEAVRTVFAWSYRALPEQAARLFRLLGVHPGPAFSVHAAAALAAVTVSRARQVLDTLVGAHLVEQSAPDRYQFHDLLRAYAVDQVQREETPQEREAALLRVLEWYLHTADAAQSWIKPDEAHLELGQAGPDVRPLVFADYNASVDWSEREYPNVLHLVSSAVLAGWDRQAWQLSAVAWNALPPSAALGGWLEAGRIGLEAARRLGDLGAQVVLLSDLGMAYRGVGRLEESLECHRAALAVAREMGDRLEEAHALNLIGLIHLRRRRLDDAAGHFEQAAAMFQDVHQPQWQATALSNLAGTLLAAGRLPQAAAAVEQALAAHRALDNPRGVGNVLRLAADLHRERGETEEALRCSQEAVEIALQLRDLRLEGFWLITLGHAQLAGGQVGDALVSYQRSAVLHRRLGDRSREALAWHGAGEAYGRLDRCEDAAALHRQAAAVQRELGDAWNEALALEGLGVALLPRAPQEARECWRQALDLLAAYGDPRAVATRGRLERRPADSA